MELPDTAIRVKQGFDLGDLFINLMEWAGLITLIVGANDTCFIPWVFCSRSGILHCFMPSLLLFFVQISEEHHGP